MRNLPLLDTPYNIFKLEVFDILLILTVPSPLIVLGTVVHPLFFIPYPFAMLGVGVRVRNMKKDKAFGYMQRYIQGTIDRIKEKLGYENKYFP